MLRTFKSCLIYNLWTDFFQQLFITCGNHHSDDELDNHKYDKGHVEHNVSLDNDVHDHVHNDVHDHVYRSGHVHARNDDHGHDVDNDHVHDHSVHNRDVHNRGVHSRGVHDHIWTSFKEA